MIDYNNLTEDQARFFVAEGGKDDWTDGQKEEFWKNFTQAHVNIALIKGFC